MKRKLSVILIVIAFAIPGYSQDKTNTEELGDKTYYEVILEDFENTPYTEKNLKFRMTKWQKGKLSIRNEYPAPTKNSKKYLGFKGYAKQGDVYSIVPAKPLIVNKYCKSIAIWVYGKRFTGQLSIILEDANKKYHRLVLGKLDFLGWRKLIVKIRKNIAQEDEYLNQKRAIKITKIIYSPGNTKRRHAKWQYFYIDDISVMVREKYTDKQSDDW